MALRSNAPVQAPPLSGEEDLRFIRNFHDVFLAIGILLFSIGLAIGIGVFVAGAGDARSGALLLGGCCAAAAVATWLLGEFFARRRRLFLPAIAIVMSLTGFCVFAAAALYGGLVMGRELTFDTAQSDLPWAARAGILVAAAFAVIAPAAFYARFRLPFSLGMTGAGAAFFIIVLCLVLNWQTTLNLLPALMLALGVILFLAGVAFDARDPRRATRFSDNGFWLHFAAAPLILNGAFGLIGMAVSGGAGPETNLAFPGMSSTEAAPVQAAATLTVVLLLGVISLLINRRALIVSALLTTGVAIAILMQAAGLGEGALAASTLIALGGFVLILGASWHVARRGLLGWVKPDGVWARIFPPEASA